MLGFHVKPHEFDPTVQRLAFRRVVAGDWLLASHPKVSSRAASMPRSTRACLMALARFMDSTSL
jgi:hypothetical protein